MSPARREGKIRLAEVEARLDFAERQARADAAELLHGRVER